MTAALKRKAGNRNIGGSEPKKAKANSSIMSFFGAPKAATATVITASTGGSAATNGVPPPTPTSTGPLPPSSKFNKDKWVAGLTDEQRDLLQLEIDTLDPSWLGLLKDDVTTQEFLDLKRFLTKELQSGKRIFPPMEDVYSWYVLLLPPVVCLFGSTGLSRSDNMASPGPATRHSTMSRSSSSARTHTTMSTRPTGLPFRCARRRRPRRRSRTCTRL